MAWQSLYLDEVYAALSADQRGLSEDEAARRFRATGANEFEEFRPRGPVGIFFSQFRGIFMVILIGAGAVASLLGDASDAIIIFAVVALNACFGFLQERKSEQTFRLLQHSLEEKAVVVRDGEEKEVARKAVVPGDVMVIERGKRIAADCRIIVSRNLLVNEAILTGEWVSAKKEAGVVREDTPLSDRTNMLFMGTVVEEGDGRALVVATGARTEFGKIGESVQKMRGTKTPLQKTIERFSFWLGVAILCSVAGLFTAGIFRGIPPFQMFLSAVALGVAAVPEGLAISLTIILAIGMRRILEKKGLVRELFAAEALGSVSLITTDKTGTLTEARMQVSHILTGTKELLRDGRRMTGFGAMNGEESHALALRFVAAAADAVIENPEAEMQAYRIRGRPTDRALVEAALEAGIHRDIMLKKGEILDQLPFDETRKFSAAILRGDQKNTLAVVGAPEKILAHAKDIHLDGKTASLKSEYFKKVNERYLQLVQHGLRVVGIAHKVTAAASIDPKDPELLSGLSFVGFIAMRDPVRKDVKEAVALAREAGVRTVIVTGDHALTARAIAEEVGLPIPDAGVMEGGALAALTEAALAERSRAISLFARVSPSDKMKIVEAYQRSGEIVAMVGDGVNDAPAIKRADIGIALGSGTDIAKETSDLVLLDDSFATIIAAIREGRIILENVRKTLVFLLSDGFTEIIIVAMSIFFGLPLPLLPAQILWINLIEDNLPALALAFERGNDAVMALAPEKNVRLLPAPLVAIIGAFGMIVGLAAFGIFAWLNGSGGTLAHAESVTMALVGIDSLFYIFSVKNLRSNFFHAHPFDNPVLILSVVVGLALLVGAVSVPFLRSLLHTVPLSLQDWMVVAGFGVFTIFCIEGLKFLFLRFLPRGGVFRT